MSNLEIILLPPDPNRPKTLSGWCTFGLLKGPIAAAAAVNGVVTKLRGKNWKDGYDQINKLTDKHVLHPAVQFADRNNAALIKGAAIGGATAAFSSKKDNSEESKAKVIAVGVVVGTATAAGDAYMKENTPPSNGPGEQTGPA